MLTKAICVYRVIRMVKSRLMRYLWRGIILGAILLVVPTTQAQIRSLEAEATYAAGPNIYINIGREDGVFPGDTLAVSIAGKSLGNWIALSASSRRAVIKSLANETINVGDRLLVAVPNPPPTEQEVDLPPRIAEKSPDQRPKSVMATPATATKPRPTSSVRLSGRVTLSLGASVSETRSIVDESSSVRRTNTLPGLGINLRAYNLPYDLVARVSARSTYRYSTPEAFTNTTSTRVYAANLEKDFRDDNIVVSVGRFTSRYESFSNFWDGISVRAGGKQNGIGVTTGFQPNRYNEGFSPDLPKYTVFVNMGTSSRNLRYDADISFTDVHGQDNFSRHMIAGLEQSLRVGRSRFRSEVQVNRDPTLLDWEIVRLRASSSIKLSRHNFVDFRHDRQKSFSLWTTTTLPTASRIRTTASYNYRHPSGSIGFSATKSTYGEQAAYTSLMTLFSLNTLPRNLRFTGHSSYWYRSDNNGLSTSMGLEKHLRATRFGLRYRLSRTTISEQAITTHTLSPSFSLRVNSSVNWTTQASLLTGDILTNYSMFTSLSLSF